MIHRVLHVICPGPIMGAERSVLSAAAELGQRVEVLLLVMLETRAPESGTKFLEAAAGLGIPTRVVPMSGRLDLRAVRRVERVLGDFRSEVVHAHGYKALFYLTAVRLSGSANLPSFVYSYHGATSHTRTVRLYEELELVLMRRADLVFAVSRASADMLRRKGVSNEKVVVVPNMLALPIAPRVRSRRPNGSLRLMFVGRLSVEKGLATLLEALTELDVGFNARLSVFGDGPLRESLQDRAAGLGVEKQVLFEGYVENVWQRAGEFDAMVMPSLAEGMPMALIEAEAAGLPVVATRVGGIPEMLSDSPSAIMVEPEDPGALARSLRELRNNIDDLGEAAQKRAPRVARRYSAVDWARTACSHYTSLAQGTSRKKGSRGRDDHEFRSH